MASTVVGKSFKLPEFQTTGVNEVHEMKGKRDRANQEIFLHENYVRIDQLPLEELNQMISKLLVLCTLFQFGTSRYVDAHVTLLV